MNAFFKFNKTWENMMLVNYYTHARINFNGIYESQLIEIHSGVVIKKYDKNKTDFSKQYYNYYLLFEIITENTTK